MSEPEWIAEREAVVVIPNAGTRAVRLRISRTVKDERVDYRCAVLAGGLDDQLHWIYGVDSWQSVLLAISFLRSRVDHWAGEGTTFHWPGSEGVMTPDSVFSSQPRQSAE